MKIIYRRIVLRFALGFLLIQLVPDRRLFLLLDRLGRELLEGSSPHNHSNERR